MHETMGNQQEVSNKELGWLSGIINCKGRYSIAFNKQDKKVRCDLSLSLNQCSPSMVERFVTITNKLGVNPKLASKPLQGNQNYTEYKITIVRMKHLRILNEKIIPHMVGDNLAQAVLMNQFIERRERYSSQEKRINTNIADDPESVELAISLSKETESLIPKDVAHVLRDYPLRSTR